MFNPTKKFNLWWLIVLLHIAGIAIAVNQNLHLLFWENDITYLSSLILVLWIICSVVIGIEIYTKKSSTDTNWFLADGALSLGMIGTVVGFIFMLSTTFINIDPGNIDSMRSAIVTIATGMSTALYTTLAGLVCSLSLKLQLVIQDR